MPQRSRRAFPTALVLAVTSAVLALGSACSSGHGHPKSSPKAIKSATPTPTPSGPCQISTTVTCTKGVLPVWTLDQLHARLLDTQDVLPSMTHPYDPTWWGTTVYNQYASRQASGNFVPGCHYYSTAMSGPRVISGHNALWSDYDPQYPHWPRESITQFAYAYTDTSVEEKDINTVWNRQCTTGHFPYRQLEGGHYIPPEQDEDQTTTETRSGWAHKRIVEKKVPDNTASPEEDVFDFLQNGNVLIVDFTFEQYTVTPKDKDWARTLSDADKMLDRQIAKLNGPQ